MKNKVMGMFTAMTMVLSILPTEICAADFSGGGTEAEPYLISTAAQLAELSQDAAGGTDYSGNTSSSKMTSTCRRG